MMKKVIFKYDLRLENGSIQELELPVDASLLHVDVQGTGVALWYELYNLPEEEGEPRTYKAKLAIVGTGEIIDEEDDEFYRHLGTVTMPPFVWHIYEVVALAGAGSSGEVPPIL